MQSRFAIVLMSIAGAAVLFGIGFTVGLGVLTTPPAAQQQHKQIAVTTEPTKVTRQETTSSGKHDDSKPDPGRALTPLYPVAPGGSAAQAEQAKSADAQAKSVDASAKAAPQQPAPQQPQQQQQAKAPAPAAAPAAEPPKPAAREEPKTQEAKAAPAQAAAKADPAPAASAPKNVTPVSLQGRNACNVSACARAYHSFRESDCTYQPYSGPRQVCVSPPGANEASRSPESERAARRDVGRRDDARVTEGRGRGVDDAEADDAAPRRYHRDFTADGEDDRIVVVPADDGRGDAVDAAPDEDDDDQ